jgi:hypothetical protein
VRRAQLHKVGALVGTHGVEVDVSPAALEVAHGNAVRYELTGSCTFVVGTFAAIPALATEGPPFDVVVCNPPYHVRSNRTMLDPAVVASEPGLALFVGASLEADADADGLHHYRDVIASTVRHALLGTRGVLVFEVFRGNAPKVEQLLLDAGFCAVEVHRDARNCVRVVEGRWEPTVAAAPVSTGSGGGGDGGGGISGDGGAGVGVASCGGGGGVGIGGVGGGGSGGGACSIQGGAGSVSAATPWPPADLSWAASSLPSELEVGQQHQPQ